MISRVICALLLAAGVAAAGPNANDSVFVDMDTSTAGIQSSFTGSDTGQTFVYKIVAHNVTNLMGAQIVVGFDKTKYSFVSSNYGSAFNNSMANIWAGDSSTFTLTYARLGMTPTSLTAAGAEMAIVVLKSKMARGDTAAIRVVSGVFGATGNLNDNFRAANIVNGVYGVRAMRTLTASAAANGSVSPNGAQSVLNGDSIQIAATPSAHYGFSGWTATVGAANVVIRTPGAATTWVVVNGDATVQASFTRITHTLTVSAGANGTVAPTGAQTVGEGDSIQVAATAAGGYNFANWSATVGAASVTIRTPSAATTWVVVNGDATVQATFAHVIDTLTVAAGAHGTVAPTGAQSVAQGDSISVAATAATGYHFVKWTATAGAANVTIRDTNAASTEAVVSGKATVTASFAANQYVLTVTASDTNGTVSPATANVNYGDSVRVIAAPHSTYRLLHWTVVTGGANAVIRDTTADTTWIIVTGAATIAAAFDQITGVVAIRAQALPTVYGLTAVRNGVQYALPAGSSAVVTIVNMRGVVAARLSSSDSGYRTIDLRQMGLSSGRYVCTMTAGSFRRSVTVLVSN